ncbi:MAG: hypothetical protein MZV63_36715 [Marinilabiliales bacterium]|nr:hypothetical protein [Marinilabiliales bacterium]
MNYSEKYNTTEKPCTGNALLCRGSNEMYGRKMLERTQRNGESSACHTILIMRCILTSIVMMTKRSLRRIIGPMNISELCMSHGWGLATDIRHLSSLLEKTIFAVDELTRPLWLPVPS